MVHVKAKQNKPANKQVKQIKQAKLKPYQSKQVEHQKLNQTTPFNQASQPISESQAKLVSQPNTGKQCWASK